MPEASHPLEPRVLDQLYRRYAGLVRRRVRRFYSPQETPDVVSEVFERVARSGGSFDGNASWSTWLYQVTTRHCINRIRDARRRRELFQLSAVEGWQSALQPAATEAHVLLGQLWKSLDPDLVDVAVYYHIDGMTQADIGALMGVSDRTISTRLARFREAALHASGETP